MWRIINYSWISSTYRTVSCGEYPKRLGLSSKLQIFKVRTWYNSRNLRLSQWIKWKKLIIHLNQEWTYDQKNNIIEFYKSLKYCKEVTYLEFTEHVDYEVFSQFILGFNDQKKSCQRMEFESLTEETIRNYQLRAEPFWPKLKSLKLASKPKELDFYSVLLPLVLPLFRVSYTMNLFQFFHSLDAVKDRYGLTTEFVLYPEISK